MKYYSVTVAAFKLKPTFTAAKTSKIAPVTKQSDRPICTRSLYILSSKGNQGTIFTGAQLITLKHKIETI